MKKIAIIIVITLLAIIALFLLNNKPINLEKYVLKSDYYEFKIKNNTYAIGNIIDSPSSQIGLFYKHNNEYYIIKKIDKCAYTDNAFYIKDDNIYLHCYNKADKIIVYTLHNTSYEENEYQLNFKDTPNISLLHLQFNKIDDDYIYLYSVVKNDETLEDGGYIKCSLKNYKCVYDNGYTPYNGKTDKSYKLIYKKSSPDKNKTYNIKIYQNTNNISVVIDGKKDFKAIQYDIKSNKKITKNDINLQWVNLNGDLYNDKNDDLSLVTITILNQNDQYNNYSDRTVNLKTSEVRIGDNWIIK